MHDILLIAVAAVVTAATRFLPFLIFRKKDSTPPIVTHLGQVLPCAIMGMLVVYCMKDVPFLHAPYGAPEIIGCLIVALLHIWKRNSLLSIGVGTVCYMLMVQLIF
jgi:branched-subunit amino acid transport protein AzlD